MPLARRWQCLDAEVKELRGSIEKLIHMSVPQLFERFGIGIDSAAEILIVAGDNNSRRSRGRACGDRSVSVKDSPSISRG